MAASLPSVPQLWPSVLPFPLPLPAYESQSSSPDDHLRFQGGLHETESEDDDADDYNDNDNDYAGGLARRIAHSMLDDEIEENTVVDLALDYPKISIAASPQSTLYNISSSQYGVSEASSKASSGAPSSPSAIAEFPLQENDWDLLNTAAGEVARLRSQKTNETFNFSNPSLCHPSHNIDDLKDRQEKNWHFDISQYKEDHSYLKDAMNCQEPQWKRWSNIEDEPKVDNRQFLLQASQGRAYNSSKKEMDSYRHSPVGFYNRPWPEMGGAIPGSGMRALFLTANNRGSGGTGVFLPRHYGSSYDNSKKKPSFSTVLLPSKVVHALNLQLDDSPPPQQLKTSAWPSLVSPSNKVLPQSPLPSSRSYASVAAKGNNQIQTLTKPVSTLQQITADISLPTEWTY